MSQPWTTILIVLVIGFGLVLVVWAVFATFPRVPRLVERSFWCPYRSRDVTVEFQENPWDNRPLQVDRCSAFVPPTAVRCEKLCLHLSPLPAAQLAASRGGRAAG